jgi:hypothetical protein
VTARKVIIWGALAVGAVVIVHGVIRTCGETSSDAYRVAMAAILEHPDVKELVGADVRIASPRGFEGVTRSSGILERKRELVSYTVALAGSRGSARADITLELSDDSPEPLWLWVWKDGRRHVVIEHPRDRPQEESVVSPAGDPMTEPEGEG